MEPVRPLPGAWSWGREAKLLPAFLMAGSASGIPTVGWAGEHWRQGRDPESLFHLTLSVLTVGHGLSYCPHPQFAWEEESVLSNEID